MMALLLTPDMGVKAGPHPQYKPHKVTGVPTYNNTGDIGNAIFTLKPTTWDQKDYPEAIDKLEFVKANVPKFYCRRFFPCTLKEAIDYISKKEATASSFRLQTNIKLVKGSDLLATGVANAPITSDMLTPTYNTSHVECTQTDVGLRLLTLDVGQYTVHVESYVTYEYVADRLTGRKAPSNILLAAGKLPVFIK
jgi:hypothetical protein